MLHKKNVLLSNMAGNCLEQATTHVLGIVVEYFINSFDELVVDAASRKEYTEKDQWKPHLYY